MQCQLSATSFWFSTRILHFLLGTCFVFYFVGNSKLLTFFFTKPTFAVCISNFFGKVMSAVLKFDCNRKNTFFYKSDVQLTLGDFNLRLTPPLVNCANCGSIQTADNRVCYIISYSFVENFDDVSPNDWPQMSPKHSSSTV